MIEPILETIKSIGITECGICKFEDLPAVFPCRAVSFLPKNPQSVIVCLFPYHIGNYEQTNVSRYAIIDDYHIVVEELLQQVASHFQAVFPQATMRCFVDNSPIHEVKAAYLAGLGVIGKHTLLINKTYGSYVFIGTIVTDQVLPTSTPLGQSCLGCNLCITHCPTHSLSNEGTLCLETCRSHITQKKGQLSSNEIQQIQDGNLIWGCDICNDICPMNIDKKSSTISAFYQHITPLVTNENLQEMIKRKAYGYRGIRVLERNLEILKNNEESSI